MKPIYLDYNATTPLDREVVEAMRPYLEEHFGNPSSAHWYGTQSRQALEDARRQVADLLHCDPGEVVFTSGGTESNNYAIRGSAFALASRGDHLITSSVEHPAVTEVCRYLETKGFRVTSLPVDEFGLVSPADVEASITPRTVLISIMHANNEVGTVQPIEEIAEIAHRYRIPFHTDAAQSVGKLSCRVDVLGIDLMSIAGHKLYAPKGVGALYIRKGTHIEKLIHGAGHEKNRRAGTENVPGIVGLGQACMIANRDLGMHTAHMKTMRDRLQQALTRELGPYRINGHPLARLPNTLSVSFASLDAGTLLSEMKEIAASAGAACHSDHVNISHVLKAMNVPLDQARGTVRFSTGRDTTGEEIDRAARIIAGTVKRMTKDLMRGD